MPRKSNKKMQKEFGKAQPLRNAPKPQAKRKNPK
jgi:hypothetical protein